MQSHLALPRQECLNQIFHALLCLKKYYGTKVVFESSDLIVQKIDVERQECESREFRCLFKERR